MPPDGYPALHLHLQSVRVRKLIVKTKAPPNIIYLVSPIAADFPAKINRSSFPLRGERLRISHACPIGWSCSR